MSHHCVEGRLFRISVVAHVDFRHIGQCSDVLSCYQGATKTRTRRAKGPGP